MRRSVRADELDEHFRYQERQRRCRDDVQPSVEGVRNFRGQRPEPGGDVDANEHAPERHAPRDGAHHSLDPIAAGSAGKSGQSGGDNALRQLSNDICDGDHEDRERCRSRRGRPSLEVPVHRGPIICFLTARSAMAGEHDRVNRDVDREGDAAKHKLIASRQSIGVEDWQNVMCDEISLVAGFAGAAAKTILERRQRADPARELDESAPDDRRHVEPGDARPAQHEDRAQHHKEDEREMQRDDGVGGHRVTCQVESTRAVARNSSAVPRSFWRGLSA